MHLRGLPAWAGVEVHADHKMMMGRARIELMLLRRRKVPVNIQATGIAGNQQEPPRAVRLGQLPGLSGALSRSLRSRTGEFRARSARRWCRPLISFKKKLWDLELRHRCRRRWFGLLSELFRLSFCCLGSFRRSVFGGGSGQSDGNGCGQLLGACYGGRSLYPAGQGSTRGFGHSPSRLGLRSRVHRSAFPRSSGTSWLFPFHQKDLPAGLALAETIRFGQKLRNREVVWLLIIPLGSPVEAGGR